MNQESRKAGIQIVLLLRFACALIVWLFEPSIKCVRGKVWRRTFFEVIYA
jgi:hypothetical protein